MLLSASFKTKIFYLIIHRIRINFCLLWKHKLNNINEKIVSYIKCIVDIHRQR